MPPDFTYSNNKRWFTGGWEPHGSAPLSDARADIRVYNPFVINAVAPYTGVSGVWVMLENDVAEAQVGWVKTYGGNDPDPTGAYVFSQITTSAGVYQPIRWYGRIDPPSVDQYQVSTDRAGHFYFYFRGGLQGQDYQPGWTPTNHDVFGEVGNYTGDQLAGDTTQFDFAQNIDYALLPGGWQGNSDFTGQWESGYAGVGTPTRANDILQVLDGRTFRLWDGRCP